MEDATGSRFLVVEDDAALLRSLGRLVRQYGEPTLAGSASEARRILATKGGWDGFVIDIGLPDGSGLDVLADARVDCPDTPALVLSGCTEGPTINAAADLDAVYLVKPVSDVRIRRFLQGALPSPRRSPEAPRSTDPTPETFDACIEQLRALFSNRQDVPTRYAIGATISSIKSRPHLFGAGAMQAVAKAVGEDLPSLYRHAAVAEQWTVPEMEALAVRKGCSGRPLSWSHLAILGTVVDRRARAKLVTRALDEGLSVRELTEMVEEEVDRHSQR